jgi:regulator of nucleoside diphosphate kinase
MTLADYQQLSTLSQAANTLGGAMLSQEVDRAIVVGPNEPTQRFVRLHSQVQYMDVLSGRTRTLQVVPPDQADIDRRRVSVLSPVGAALIGLAAGDSYSWSGEDGRPHVLIVVDVGGAHARA